MSRKRFIESHGATCDNWNWSWSFINKDKHQIIFGAWDHLITGTHWLILTSEWKLNKKGNKNPGFKQSREHIRLIEEEGYQLLVFIMVQEEKGAETVKIKNYEKILRAKKLTRKGDIWYAIDLEESILPEEILDQEDCFIEGAKEVVTVNSYERNPEARNK